MDFRIITYNIHKGIGGVDRRYDPDRIIDTLARYDPDILFLQEVDDGVPRSRRHRQVDLIGNALDLPHRVYQRNVSLKYGHYGNAIISRHRLINTRDIELTVPLKKRRRAISTKCILRGHRKHTVHLVNCHLGLAAFERRIQLKKILDADTVTHLRRTTPLIVAGDYNDVWGTLGRRIMEPQGFQPACKATKTFPAFMPVRALDRIYFKGQLEFKHSFAAHTKLARQASDHLPVIADFKLFE